MYATYVIKTNARSVLTRFTVGGSITDYIDDPAKGPPGEVSKLLYMIGFVTTYLATVIVSNSNTMLGKISAAFAVFPSENLK